MNNGQPGETKPRLPIGANDVRFFVAPNKSFGDKYWLGIEFETKDAVYVWVPRLEHQWLMAKAIAACEDHKYQNGKGRIVPGRFVIDAFLPESELDDDMAKEYGFARSESILGVGIEGLDELCESMPRRGRQEVAGAFIEHLFRRIGE
jgi:hypothetical protein